MLTTKTVDFSVNAGCFRSRGSSAGRSFAGDVGVRACDAEALRDGSFSPFGVATPAALAIFTEMGRTGIYTEVQVRSPYAQWSVTAQPSYR